MKRQQQTTIFIILGITWIVFYYQKYGLANFLWFSDATFLVAFAALITQNNTLKSMVSLAFIPEMSWVFSFFVILLTHNVKYGASFVGYLFDRHGSLLPLDMAHVISIVMHLGLPPLSVYFILTAGYNHIAFTYELLLVWILCLLSNLVSDRSQNINIVFSYPWSTVALFMSFILWTEDYIVRRILRIPFPSPPTVAVS